MRIVSDAGISGVARVETFKPYLKPHILHRIRVSKRDPAWWYDIVDGLPDLIVRNGLIEVWDRPGLGVEINPEKARRYLAEEDAQFFA